MANHSLRFGFASKTGLTARPSRKHAAAAVFGFAPLTLSDVSKYGHPVDITADFSLLGAPSSSAYPDTIADVSDVLAIFDFGVSGSIITPYEFDNAGGGGITGPINADDVAYGDSDVQAILDGLLYVAPQIGSFANNRGTVEKGSTITSVHLSWSLNKDMDSLSLNQSIGEIDADATSYDVTSVSLTSDTTYTLTADDGTSQTQASTSVAFRQKRYWGVSSETSLDNSGILALGNSEFSTNLSKSITYDCTGGAYPYFAYPASFGQPQNVTVGGLAFTDFAINTQTFTNASGYAESYYVIRFNGIQTGSSIKVVWG